MADNGRGERADQKAGIRLGAGGIASLGGLGLLVIFMLQNTEDVTISFLVWDFSWPLWLTMLLTAVFGALFWFGVGVVRRHQRRSDRRATRG